MSQEITAWFGAILSVFVMYAYHRDMTKEQNPLTPVAIFMFMLVQSMLFVRLALLVGAN